jgi:glycosyltransferase involved in cell wall biosynthesis
VARYTYETARALCERHADRIAGYVLNPDLPPPGGMEPFVATGRVCFSTEVPWEAGGIWHSLSPIELSVPIERAWPATAVHAGTRLVVTLYDLIPERLAATHLEDPGLRRRYRTRLEFVRAAHHVCTISHHTSADAVELLHLDSARITMVGAAPSDRFRPAADPALARASARGGVPALRDEFVLFNGGMDPRKNLEGLLAAWACVPEAVQRRYQLVVACHANDLDRNHYEVIADRLGVRDSLLMTGYVPDDILVALTQSTDLAVFPSLYEGFGLPVAEALACHTPVVAANTSCLPELLEADALFDPRDPSAMAHVITAALTDDGFLASLVAAQRARPVTAWGDVADRVIDAYDAVAARPVPSPRRSRRVAYVSPLPPQRSGVAEWSYLLLEQLRKLCTVDAFADGFHLDNDPPVAPEGVAVQPVRGLPFADAAWAGYDTVIYNLGNSEFHAGALRQLRKVRGVVIAHEVRLTDLYALSADRPGAVPDGFATTVERLYPGVLPAELRGAPRLAPEQAERLGILMTREVVELSERFLVTNEFAAGLARVDAGPSLEDRVDVMPFAIFPPNYGDAPDPPRGAPPIVASFGLVHDVKRPDVLIAAFAAVRAAVPDARLAVVGRCSDALAAAVRDAAHEAGVADAVELTGAVDEKEYAAWHARATVAVQLRTTSNGESSGAIGNCLSFGIPTIVAALGAARELPDNAVVKVPPTVDATTLADTITSLLRDEPRRRDLRRGAFAYAAAHSHAVVARWLYDNAIAR